MRKIFLTPLIRVSFGLAMLTVSLLFVSELLGLVPDRRAGDLENRRVIAQSLAVQLSAAITHNATSAIEETLNSVVKWNDSILSAAIRPTESEHIYQFGDHSENWTLKQSDKSTATQIQVAVYDADGRWGTMEVRFAPLGATNSIESFKESNLALVLFIAVIGFVCYMIFLRRVVVELNTDNVIPNRVRRALDSLTESLLIVDKSGIIVFSNRAFSIMTGLPSEDIIGKTAAAYHWEFDTTLFENIETPWDRVLDGSTILQGELIKLKTENNKTFHLTVNATPVLSTEDTIQGALITFNDITEIENKNEQLRITLRKLEETQAEVSLQNEQLQILATRDPMTNVLNRRSLFDKMDKLFSKAVSQKTPLSFIMVDIDHFKSVNDTYGHATGDRVIVFLANCLSKYARETDLVARFGGEEFCIVLPETEIQEAANLAEKIRLEVENGHGGDYVDELKITASFGVSILTEQLSNSNGLFELADQALYKAKAGGRNQVVCWSEFLSKETALTPRAVRKSDDNERIIASEEGDQSLLEVNIEATPAIINIDNAIAVASVSGKIFAVLVIEIDIIHSDDLLDSAFPSNECVADLIKRYNGLIRDTDTLLSEDNDEFQLSVSPFGNREILLLLNDFESVDSVNHVLDRIYQTNQTAATAGDQTYYATSTIGISTFPDDGKTAVSLLKNATMAKREAMRVSGENNHVFFADIAAQTDEHKLGLTTTNITQNQR